MAGLIIKAIMEYNEIRIVNTGLGDRWLQVGEDVGILDVYKSGNGWRVEIDEKVEYVTSEDQVVSSDDFECFIVRDSQEADEMAATRGLLHYAYAILIKTQSNLGGQRHD